MLYRFYVQDTICDNKKTQGKMSVFFGSKKETAVKKEMHDHTKGRQPPMMGAHGQDVSFMAHGQPVHFVEHANQGHAQHHTLNSSMIAHEFKKGHH
jgi:hypothetical protein